MNRMILILPLMACTFSLIQAEDTRDQVRNEILKSFDEAIQTRETTIDELRDTVNEIDNARAERGNEEESQKNTEIQKSTETQIAESHAIGNISQSVAKVEIAKIQAKDKIVKAIVKVEGLESGQATPEQIEQEKALSAKKIANAVSAVEIAKVKAAKNIIHANKHVEMSKMKEKQSSVDNAAALTIAKNRSAVKIAESVSAVEITEAVSNVTIAKALISENMELSLKEKYKDLTLEEIKAQARADISTIKSSMEVARAKALSDIAKIVSFVEIAEAIKKQDKHMEDKKNTNTRETYSRDFVRFYAE